ncbi:TPR-like protein [Exidia glandulosa HHB12029]|uniref:TPR-like protein n=1 Tax=Exidia glandulosa HHB12029 TaxID=1314781 RepID=A0A165N6K0_EXIGL|nr:TPR-like protein [Exidia glandulosa HHB12029]
MAAFIKNKLKAARDLLGKKDYAGARDAANDVLSYEADNYNANVFLGLANLELGQLDASEQAYKRATSSNPEQLLAWQGLTKFYERTERWEDHVNGLHEQLRLFCKAEDATKCAEVVQRVIDIRRAHGTPMQVVEALKLMLPTSPYYSVLSALPDADPSAPTATTTFTIQRAVHHSLPTLQEIIAIIEKEEESFMTREFNKRRTRLNAGSPEKVKREVGLEVWSASELPKLYNELLGHPDAGDDLRREAEAKLLRQRLSYLQALGYAPSSSKSERQALSAEVMDMISGVVLLNITNEQAWRTYLDTRDVLHMHDYDVKLLRGFCALFPSLALSRLIDAYLRYNAIPAPDEDDVEDDEEEAGNAKEEEEIDEDALMTTMMDAFEEGPASVTASRLLAEVYYKTRDHESSIKVAQSGLECVSRIESELAVSLPLLRRAFDTILATGLVHHFPPKHHARATPIIDRILTVDADDVPCLLARAYILQHAKRWEEATAVFDRVVTLTAEDEDDDVNLEAEEEAAWCMVNNGLRDEAEARLNGVLERLRVREGYEEQKARASWRLGRCLWDSGSKQDAYAQYIASLKFSSSFAPAFTSLGTYYLEAASPPDPARASKCFQKAFELDAREAEAARRLAEGFADEQEWDLVEIVARRTIEGEGGTDIVATQAAKYLPLNAWAWKAVGVVELHRRNYTAAIQSLQIALRADENDASCWTRLGEAYLLSGRHPAALKTFLHAKELDENDWTIDFFTANVRQELYEFDEAIALYEGILASRPQEDGVVFALAHTHLLAALKYDETGFLERAIECLASALHYVLQLLASASCPKRGVWKTLADSLLAVPLGARWSDSVPLLDAFAAVVDILPADCGELASFLKKPDAVDAVHIDGVPLPLVLAALVCAYRISLIPADDTVSIAAASFDLGATLQRVRSHLAVEDRKAACTVQILACMKRTVRADPSSDMYWAALGQAQFESNVQIAQHAFIKAIECDGTNASHWADLGLLYLHHGDRELANQALLRAQIVDPDHTIAWGAQALVAIANNHVHEARTLLDHAIGLPRTVPELDLDFAARIFQELSSSTKGADTDRLLPVFAVLDRYRKRHVGNPTALHLFALTCERLRLYDLATEVLLECMATLETLYEHSEDPATERQYVIANTTLGRLRLATGEYAAAVESFSVAQSLLGTILDDDSAALQAEVGFCSGLANLKLGDFEAALGQLESALQNAPEHATAIRGHCTLLLSQALWTMGGEESQEAARGQLLECIAANPEDLPAILGLACIGMLTSDDGLVDATLSEVLALPLDRRLQLDPRRDVSRIQILQSLLQDRQQDALAEAQRAVHIEPQSATAALDLGRLLLQMQSPAAAYGVVSTNTSVLLPEHTRIAAISQGQLGGEEETAAPVRTLQRALLRAPWDRDTWRALALTRD